MSGHPIDPDWDSLPWWRALDEDVLLTQQCADCSTHRWPPRALCPRCSSFETEWVWSPGRGRVVSWVVTMRSFAPGPEVPYTTVLVRLEEQDDLLLPGTFVGDIADLSIGTPVVGVFAPHPAEPGDRAVDGDERPTTLLNWRVQ